MVRNLSENPIWRVAILTIFTLLVSVFLKLLSNPSRNPFKLKTYHLWDIDLGAELMITAWVSYFIAIAESINRGMDATTAFGKYELVNILLVVVALITPMYVRLNCWISAKEDRYQPTDQVVWIPNVVCFLTLVVTAYLAKGMVR